MSFLYVIFVANTYLMKTKRERFETVAAKRVQRIINDLKLLSNCANRNNYEYNGEDITKMMSVIRIQVKKTEEIFNISLDKRRDEFKF